MGLSFNYNRFESDMQFYSFEALKKATEDNSLNSFKFIEPGEKSSSVLLSELSGTKKLWKLFILFTLFFLLIEIALIRFLK
jgi:hypothetical protein